MTYDVTAGSFSIDYTFGFYRGMESRADAFSAIAAERGEEMQLQDCGKAQFFFEPLFLLVVFIATCVIYLNIMYLGKMIPRFGREHYIVFWRLGGRHGARREWAEAGPWQRMLISWKSLGFSDLEAETIARTELYAAIEAMLSCIVVTLVYKQAFPVVGKAIGLCS